MVRQSLHDNVVSGGASQKTSLRNQRMAKPVAIVAMRNIGNCTHPQNLRDVQFRFGLTFYTPAGSARQYAETYAQNWTDR